MMSTITLTNNYHYLETQSKYKYILRATKLIGYPLRKITYTVQVPSVILTAMTKE